MSSRWKRCHQAARCLSCHAWLQLMKIESFSDTKHCKGCFQLPVFEKTRSYLDLLNPWQHIRRCGTLFDYRFMLILKMTPRCGETHIFTHSYYDPFQGEERHVTCMLSLWMSCRLKSGQTSPVNPACCLGGNIIIVGNITMVMDKLLGVSCWG